MLDLIGKVKHTECTLNTMSRCPDEFPDHEDYDNCTARRDFYAPAAECERCGRMDELKERDGLMCCYDCQEELDQTAWDAKHDAPLTGDKALLYADEQPACLVAAYEHGATEDEMLALLRAHIAECVHCGSTAATVQTDRLYLNPAAVCCEAGDLYTSLLAA
jgi:hypothetical protein